MTSTTLAIRNGDPVFPEGAPQWPVTTDAIRDSVLQALTDGSWGKYHSQFTETLVEQLAARFDHSEVLLCSSGTIAVELALRGIGVSADDEVVLAGYDFPGNFRAIESIGATPVLTDVAENGWVLTPENVAAAMSEKTVAVIVSHLHGQVADIPAIRNAINEAGVPILEDNCQMPGGSLNGTALGLHGDVAAFSFGGSKLLSAGRGGAVITRDDAIAQRARIYSSRGNEAFPLSQLQAAALLPQLATIDAATAKRIAAVDLLNSSIADPRLVPLKQVTGGDVQPGFYKLPWQLKTQTGDWTREEFILAIQAEGVAIDIGFRGFTRRSSRRCRKAMPLVNSLIAAEKTLLLHHPILLNEDADIRRVATAIEKVLGNQPAT